MSDAPFVSLATRLPAAEANATKQPFEEMEKDAVSDSPPLCRYVY